MTILPSCPMVFGVAVGKTLKQKSITPNGVITYKLCAPFKTIVAQVNYMQ